jgi:large subunit ribosomal protein L29
MKTKDIREKDEAALQAELVDIRKQLFTLRTQAVTQKIESPAKIKVLKRDVARIHTVLNENKRKAQANAAAK